MADKISISASAPGLKEVISLLSEFSKTYSKLQSTIMKSEGLNSAEEAISKISSSIKKGFDTKTLSKEVDELLTKYKSLLSASKQVKDKYLSDATKSNVKSLSNAYVLKGVTNTTEENRNKFLKENGLNKRGPFASYRNQIDKLAIQIDSGKLSGKELKTAKNKLTQTWNAYIKELYETFESQVNSSSVKKSSSTKKAVHKITDSVEKAVQTKAEDVSTEVKKSSKKNGKNIELKEILDDINSGVQTAFENITEKSAKELSDKTKKKSKKDKAYYEPVLNTQEENYKTYMPHTTTIMTAGEYEAKFGKNKTGEYVDFLKNISPIVADSSDKKSTNRNGKRSTNASLKVGTVSIPGKFATRQDVEWAKAMQEQIVAIKKLTKSMQAEENAIRARRVAVNERNAARREAESPSTIAARQVRALNGSLSYMDRLEGNVNTRNKDYLAPGENLVTDLLSKGLFSGAVSIGVGSGEKALRNLTNKMSRALKDRTVYKELSNQDSFKNWEKQHKGKSVKDFLKEGTPEEISNSWGELNESLKKDPKKAKKINTAGVALTTVVGGVAGAIVALGKEIGNLGTEAVKAYSNIQSLKTQLGVVFGEQSQADSMFNQIEAYAKKSPFGVEQMTQQAITLKQSGVYSSDLMEVLRRLGDISSGNAEKMKSVSETYARILSSTTVTARDMRQLSNAGVPGYKALVEAMHKYGATMYNGDIEKSKTITTSSIRSMLQSGKVTSEDFTNMLKNLTDEGGTFYGATEKGARTLKARKQNLSDMRDMAFAALGEQLASWGGSDSEHSLYNEFISFKERFFSEFEETRKNGLLIKQKEDAGTKIGLMGDVKNAPESLQKLLLGTDNYTKEEYKRVKSDYITAADAQYRKAESDLNGDLSVEKYTNAVKNYRLVASAMWGASVQGTDMESKEYLDMKKYLDSLSPKERNVLFDQVTDIYKEATPSTIFENKKNKQFYKDWTEAKHNIEDNQWEHNDRELINALTKGFEQIDADLVATTSTRNTRTQAKIKWDAGAFGSMIAGDEEFARLQKIKDKILGYWDTFIIETTDGMAKATLDATKFTSMEQFLDVEKTLIDDEEQMKLSIVDLFDINGRQYEESGAIIEQYGKQLSDFNTILTNDESLEAVQKMPVYEEFLKQIGLMTERTKDIDEESWKNIQDIIERLSTAIEKSADLSDRQKDVTLRGLSHAGIDRTYSKENADKINARQVSLWHNLVANATGITATRVKQIGGKQSMNMYATNISQRNLFNNISRALLASGTQLGEISQQLKRTGVGNDGTQLFDWVTSIKNIEEMASKRSVATQQSLVDAYKAQIDVLEELEVGGVSTLDDWNELHSASAILGSAFSIAADKMADGSYRFTEATIQAAENMKREINGKLFKELNNLTIRQSTKSITDQNKNLALSNLMLSGKYNPYDKYLPTNRVENYTEVLSNMIQQDIESGFKGATENINNLDEATRSKVEDLYKAVTGNNLYTKNVENIPLTEKRTYTEVSTDVLRLQSEYASLISDYWNQKAEAAYNSSDHWKRKYRNKNDAIAEIKANQRSGESGRNISKQAREYAIDKLEKEYNIKLGFDSNGNIKNFTKTVEVIAENGVKQLVTYTSNLTDESLKDLFENYENMTQEEQKNLLGLFETITATSNSFDAFGAALDKNTQLLNDNAWLLELREYTEKVSRFMSNVYGGPDFGNGPKTLKELDRTSPYYTAYNLSPVKNINSLMGWSENADLSKVFTFLAEEQVEQLNIERNSKYLAAVSDAVYEATRETGRQLMLNPSESTFTQTLDSGTSLSNLLDNVKNNNSQFEFVERENSEALQILLSKYGVKTRDDLLQKTFDSGDLTSTDLDNIFSVLYEIKDVEQKRAEIYNKTYSETLSKAGFTDADSEEILSNFQSNQPLFDLIGKYVANNSEQFFKAFEGYSQVTIPKWGEIQTGDLLNNVLNEDGSVNADAVQGLLYALKEVSPDALNQIVEDANKFAVSSEVASQSWEELGSTIFNTLADTAINGYMTTLEKCGELTFNMANNLWDGAEAQHEMVKTLGAISSEMLSNLGTTAVNAGLNLIAGGALMGKDGAGRIAAGLGLVAAGGGASYLAGFINAGLESDSSSDDELERLEKLKDNLADLLEQARNDAEYYETTLRNKSAISANDNLSNLTVTKVNDMILTDKGVFSTDPHDTIMAMKDPASLVGSTSVSPNVTFTIVNESGQQLDVTESKTATDENGNVAITAVINAVVKQGFMNGEYDDSITNMNMRKKGNTVYA